MANKKPRFKFFQILFLLLSLTYPVIVYVGVKKFDLGSVFVALAVVSLLKIFFGREDGNKSKLFRLSPVILLALAAIAFIFKSTKFLQFYPLIINLGYLVLFVSSLSGEQSIVEKIARLTEPNLPPPAIAYTRKVTIVWSIFFVINSVVVLYSIFFGTLEFWAFYNGFFSYILIAGLFAVEFVVRIQVKKKWNFK